MRWLFSVATVGVMAVVLAACSSGGSKGGTGGTIDGVTWKLASQTVNGQKTDVPSGVVVDAKFTSDNVAGSAGCNLYHGSVVIMDASIKLGPLATTSMACQGAAADTETAYLANLGNAATYTATSDSLTIYDGSGSEILAYTAGAANPLEGEWIVTGYNNGKEAVTSPIAGTTLTATFTADSVAGDSGCNTYSGGYTLDGDQVTIGPLASTMKACDEAIMTQETQFLTALQTPATVETTGGNVTLRDSSGATQVTLAPKQ
jgi:heat shock protein HslJ